MRQRGNGRTAIQRGTILAVLTLVGWTAGLGCRTPAVATSRGTDPIASATRTPLDRAQDTAKAKADWVVRQGQAVWRPSRRAQEIAGDITVATGGPGEFLVEFTKPSLTLVRVVSRDGRWEIVAAGRGKHSGRGKPPKRGWFELGAFLSRGSLDAPWRGERNGEGLEWAVENPRTGERIEGYFGP